MIPLNQKVKVIFAPQNDEWGIPVKTPIAKDYKVRLDFNADAKLIQSEDGKHELYSAVIYFRGSVPITYKDYIEYDTGINGLKQAQPKAIFPIADLSGKVNFTKVTV